ncbi:UNVERIFIED_CONTAM: hypothetical protein GTU68_059259 [Idotea baltica]|nr:hypothetical protein [Idotea baltica]
MGGMGFIHAAECEIMRNSALININMIDAAVKKGIPKYFFSSSACVYRDMTLDEGSITEDDAYPAQPDNEYGWEKLYAERVSMAYARRYDIEVRIARFQNCYGTEGTWRGGREKAPAALCRKVASAENGDSIDVWGDGSAMRSYTYVSDIVSGIYTLMQSDVEEPVNIGSDEFISVNELVATIAKVAGKKINIQHIDGPVGVMARNHTFDKIEAIGWKASVTLAEGIKQLYPWILTQVEVASKKGEDISAAVEISGLNLPTQ